MIETRHVSPSRETRRRRSAGESVNQEEITFDPGAIMTMMVGDKLSTSLSPDQRQRHQQPHQPQHKQLIQSLPVVNDNPQRMPPTSKKQHRKQHKSSSSSPSASPTKQQHQPKHVLSPSPAGTLGSHNAASTSTTLSTSPSATTMTASTSSITDDDGQHRTRPASTSSLLSSLPSPSTLTESSMSASLLLTSPQSSQRPKSSSSLMNTAGSSSAPSSSASKSRSSSSSINNRKSLSQKLNSSPLKSGTGGGGGGGGGGGTSSNMSVSTYHTAHTAHTNATSSSKKSKSSRCSAVQPKLVDATKLSQSLSHLVDVNFESIFDFDGDDGDNDIDTSNSTAATSATKKSHQHQQNNNNQTQPLHHRHDLQSRQRDVEDDKKKLKKSSRKQKIKQEKAILSKLHDTVESSDFFRDFKSTGGTDSSSHGSYGVARSSKDDWMRVSTDSSILLSKAGAGISGDGMEELQELFEQIDEEDANSEEREKNENRSTEKNENTNSPIEGITTSTTTKVVEQNGNSIRNDRDDDDDDDDDFFKPEVLERQDRSLHNWEPESPTKQMRKSTSADKLSSSSPKQSATASTNLSQERSQGIGEKRESKKDDVNSSPQQVPISRDLVLDSAMTGTEQTGLRGAEFRIPPSKQQHHTPLSTSAMPMPSPTSQKASTKPIPKDSSSPSTPTESSSVEAPPPPPRSSEYSVSAPAEILPTKSRDHHINADDDGNHGSDEVLRDSPHTLQRKQRKLRRQQRRLREQQQKQQQLQQSQEKREPGLPQPALPPKEQMATNAAKNNKHYQLEGHQQPQQEHPSETERSDDYISTCSDTLRTNRSDTLHSHGSFDDYHNQVNASLTIFRESLLQDLPASHSDDDPNSSRSGMNMNLNNNSSNDRSAEQDAVKTTTEKSLGDVIESMNDIEDEVRQMLSSSPKKGGQRSTRSLFSNASSAGSGGGGGGSKSVSNFSTGSATTRSAEVFGGGASSKSVSSNRSTEEVAGGSKSVSSATTNRSADAGVGVGSKSVSSATTNRSADGPGMGSKSVSSATTRSADGTVGSSSRRSKSKSPKGRRSRRNSTTSSSDGMTPKTQSKGKLQTSSSNSSTPNSRQSHRRRRSTRRRHTISAGVQPPPPDMFSSPQRQPAHYRPRRPTSHSPKAPRRAISAYPSPGSGDSASRGLATVAGQNGELGSLLSRTYLRPSRASSPPMRASSPNSFNKRASKYQSNHSQHSSIPDLTSISSVLLDVTDDDLSPLPVVPRRNSTPRTATMITAAGTKLTVPLVDDAEKIEDLMHSSASLSSPSNGLSKKTKNSKRRSSLPSPPTVSNEEIDDMPSSSPQSGNSKRRSSLPSLLSDNLHKSKARSEGHHREHSPRSSKSKTRRSVNKKSSTHTSSSMTASMSDSISMKSDLGPITRSHMSSREMSMRSEDTSMWGSSKLSESGITDLMSPHQTQRRRHSLPPANTDQENDEEQSLEPMKDFLRGLLGPHANEAPSASGNEFYEGGDFSKSSAISDPNEAKIEPIMLQMTETGGVEFETGFPQITDEDIKNFAIEDMDAFSDPFGLGGSRDVSRTPPLEDNDVTKSPSKRRSSLTDLFGLGSSIHEGSTHSRPRRKSSFLPPTIPDALRSPRQTSLRKKFSITSGSRAGDDKSEVASMSPSTRRRRSSMNIKNFDTWFKRFAIEYDSEDDEENDKAENGAWELSPGASSSVDDPVQHTGLLSSPNPGIVPQNQRQPRRHSYQERSSLEMTATDDTHAIQQETRHHRRRNSVDNASISRLNVSKKKDDRKKKKKKDKKRRLFGRRHSLDARLPTSKDGTMETGEVTSSTRYSKSRRRPRRMSLPNLSSNSVKYAKKAVRKIIIKPAKKIINHRKHRSSSVERMRAVQLLDDDDEF